MDATRRRYIWLATTVLTFVIFHWPHLLSAQDPLKSALTMGLKDVAAIKQKAEAGDADSQVELANLLTSKFHATEALEWYRKAAAQGNLDAKYHVGEFLLFGAAGLPRSLAVQPNPPEGLRWTFAAATNFHPHACWNMGKALRHGIGTSTNLVAAYAWLSLFANSSSGSIVGRVQMNELALQLDGAALRQAQDLATQFKAGRWHLPAVALAASPLSLSGITLGKKPMAVINGKTFSEGESTAITLPSGRVSVKCLKIQADSVLISVEGEENSRLLQLRK